MSSPVDEEPWMHAVGDRRNGYEITARVARGGYGEVYAVTDANGVRWAMKLVRIKGQRDRKAAKRAVLEARLLRDIDHINVVRYHDAFLDDDGTVGIVTEFLPGKPLRDVMNGGAMPVERALRIARQICQAAAVVHAKGAVHRDIKPENVFLMPADVAKLIDFGIAHCAGVELHTTRPIGTPLYMSPDHLSFDTKSGQLPDPRWDVYSIGVILYELIRGRHPFEDDTGNLPTAAVVIGRQLHGEIAPLSDVIKQFPREVALVVARALEKDPDQRYQSADAFAAALTEALRWWTTTFAAAPQPRMAEALKHMEPRDEHPTTPTAAKVLEEPTTEPRASDAGPPRFGTEKMLPHVEMRAGPTGTELMVPKLRVVNGKVVARDAGDAPSPRPSAASQPRFESPRAPIAIVRGESPHTPIVIERHSQPSNPDFAHAKTVSSSAAATPAPLARTLAMTPPRRSPFFAILVILAVAGLALAAIGAIRPDLLRLGRVDAAAWRPRAVAELSAAPARSYETASESFCERSRCCSATPSVSGAAPDGRPRRSREGASSVTRWST
jgi:serine/threonine protein kinase